VPQKGQIFLSVIAAGYIFWMTMEKKSSAVLQVGFSHPASFLHFVAGDHFSIKFFLRKGNCNIMSNYPND